MNQLLTEYFELYKEELESGLEHYSNELREVRAGRANPKMLDKVFVEYYGTMTPVNQVAGISVPEARMIVISPWDTSLIKPIKKAIEVANLGVNPNDDGKVIRLILPMLTEERRKELIKQVGKMCETRKVIYRNARRDILDECKKLKKDSKITEDDLKNAETELIIRLISSSLSFNVTFDCSASHSTVPPIASIIERIGTRVLLSKITGAVFLPGSISAATPFTVISGFPIVNLITTSDASLAKAIEEKTKAIAKIEDISTFLKFI